MISQLDGLVNALKGRSGAGAFRVAVFSGIPESAEQIATRLGESMGPVLLLQLTSPNREFADCVPFLQGKGPLMPADVHEGVYRVGGHGCFDFPAWATGETSRRLLEALESSTEPWRCSVCALALDHNEGALALAAGVDYILFEIPAGGREQANALCLLRTLLERNSKAEVGVSISPLIDEDSRLLVGKLFLSSAGKHMGSRVRLLTASGLTAVNDFFAWLSNAAGISGR